MNMSDHFTRARYRSKNSQLKVIGLILGNQIGSILEISNSIEIELDDGLPNLNYAKKRFDEYKKIPLFKDLEIIGWYSVDDSKSNSPSTQDQVCHQEHISTLCSNPLMLKLNPDTGRENARMSLPVFIFEINKENKFQTVDYLLASSVIEQIAVSHVAKAIDPNAKVSGIS